MFRSRESTWIGFEKAQQTIDALKEEVQHAEEKLIDYKRNFKFSKKLTASPVSNLNNVVDSRQDFQIGRKHFYKETIPRKFPQIEKFSQKQKFRFKKTPERINGHNGRRIAKSSDTHLVRTEEILPKHALFKTDKIASDYIIQSSDSSISPIPPYNESFSSDATSSLLADTYREINEKLELVIHRSEAWMHVHGIPSREKETDTDTSSNRTVSGEATKETVPKSPYELRNASSSNGGSLSQGLEWEPVPNGRLPVEDTEPKSLFEPKNVSSRANISSQEFEWVPVSNGRLPRRAPRFTKNGFQQIKMMIDNQKKLHEELQRRSESDSNSASNVNKITTQPKTLIIAEDKMNEDIKLPPTRKTRNVSSVPTYRGFSVPSPKLSKKRISHLNKKFNKNVSGNREMDYLKRTSKSAISNKNSLSPETLKKTETVNLESKVQVEDAEEKSSSSKISNSVSSPSPLTKDDDSKFKDSSPQNENPTNTLAKEIDLNSSSKSEEEIEDDNMEKENFKQNKSAQRNISKLPENLTSTLVKEIHLDSSTESAEEIENDDSMKKENIKPKLIKSVKRKAPKLPDQVAPSPKIRHYDVNAVRNYIKKKKEERKKKSLEEHKKELQEAENKKERLQKLYDYQKQNLPPPTKSPLKVLHSNLQESESSARDSNKEMIDPSSTFTVQKYSQENHKSPHEDSNKSANKSNPQHISDSENILDENINPSSKAILSNLSEEQSKNNKNNSKSLKDHTSKSKSPLDMPVETPAKTSEAKLNSQYCQTSYDMLFPDSSSPADEQTESDSFHETLPFEKFSFPKRPQVNTKEAETLKHLMKSIETLSEPFENLIRTKRWVEQIPPLPTHMEKSSHSASNEKSSVVSSPAEVNTGFLVDVAKTLYSTQNNSFKEQVADVGDTSQLPEKILGKPADKNQPPVDINFDTKKSPNLKSDDEISLIEGSLNSEDAFESSEKEQSSVKSASPPSSTVKTGVTVLRQNPDPFNFINTFNRKPLDVHFGVKNSSSEFESHSTSIKSKKETTTSETDSQSSQIKENSSDNTSHILSQTFYSSEFSEANVIPKVNSDSASKKDVFPSLNNDIPSQRISSRNSTTTSHPSLISGTLITSHEISSRDSTPVSHLPLVEGTLNSDLQPEDTMEELPDDFVNQKVPSLSESSVSEAISVAENSANDNDSSVSVREDVAENTASDNDSPARKDTVSSPRTSKKDKDAIINSSHSHFDAISNHLVSSFSENIPTENQMPYRRESEGSKAPLASSARNSRIESKISVSKSSSIKSVDPDSKQTISEKLYETSSQSRHHSSQSQSKSSQSHASVVEDSYSPVETERDLKEKLFTVGGNVVENVTSVSSSSPNSVTIDFTQPVRFTLANNFTSSIKVQKQNSREEPYFPSHIVTRVAAEAAAAALTVVVSTQKELLGLESRSSPEARGSSQGSIRSSRKLVSHRPSSQLKNASGSVIEEEINKETSRATTTNGNSDSDERKYHTPSEHSPTSSRVSSAISEQLPNNKSSKKNVRSSFSHKRKISGNASSPSPASLSENESISSATLISSHSEFTEDTATESIHSDDSYAQLTLDVVRRMAHDDESRARDQLSLLRMQEKSVVEKARDKMRLLEVLKKKLQEKGADKKKISVIKKSQKELISRLRQERAHLRCMQEAYRSVCEKHQSMFITKHELLSDPTSLSSQILHRKNKQRTSKLASQSKTREVKSPASSSNSSALSEKGLETAIEEDKEILEVPDISKSATSISSQGTVVESGVSAQSKSSVTSQNNSIKIAPVMSQSDFKPSSPDSYVLNQSMDQAAQASKKLEASKRHLAKREQRLFQRRKNAEKLAQLEKKFDIEEKEFRELKSKSDKLMESSKKKKEYRISSSSSTLLDVDEKLPIDKETEKTYAAQSSVTESVSSEKVISEVETNGQTDSVPEENLTAAHSSRNSESSVEERVTAQGNVDSSAASSSSIQEEQMKSEVSLVKSIIETAKSSPIGEISSNNVSPNFKSPVSKSSSYSEIYSESFESPVNQKASSPISSSPETKHALPPINNKKDKGFSIRSPLIPRSMKRHDSSGSDDSYTISHSETASDQSDIEGRIHALTEQLRRRRAEAEKLKREHKKKYREHLKEKELSLQKQLEAYNQYIEKTKKELENQVESSISSLSNDISGVKPQIKWPRSDTAMDSHRLRKRASVPSDTRAFESKKITDNLSSPESRDSSIGFSFKKEKEISSKISSNDGTTSRENNQDNISVKSILTDKAKQLKSTADSSSISSEEILRDTENNTKITSKESIKLINELLHKSQPGIEKQDEAESHESSAVSVITDESIPEKDASASETESKSSYPSDSFVSDSSYSKSDNDDTKVPEKISSKSQKDQSSSGDEVRTLSKSQKEQSSSGDEVRTLSRSQKEQSSSGDEVRTLSRSQKEQSSSGDEVRTLSRSQKEQSSSGDEVSSAKFSEQTEEPHEFSEKSSNSETSARMEEDESEIDYQSEASSVSVTESVKENVEIKSNDCKGEEGCPKTASKSSDKILDAQLSENKSEIELLKDVDNKVAASKSEPNLKEMPQSETFVTNVVNYLYCNIFDDSIKAVLSLFPNILISMKHTKIDFQSKITSLDNTQKQVSEKNIDEISSSLLDTYVQDSISEILKIASQFKKSSVYENVPFKESENSPDTKSSSSSPSKTPKNENSIFQKQSMQTDETEMSIFKKEIDWFDDTFMTSSTDHSQLDPQLMIQQYPFYYRKIPNKPPPPYTPPTAVFNAQAALQLALKREKAAAQIDPVTHVTKNIDSILEHITDLFITAKREGIMLTDINDPNLSAVIEKLGLTIPCQITFLDLIFDASKEILLNSYQETQEVPQPWLKPKKLTPKPLFPCDKNKILPVLQREIEKTFKLLPKDQPNPWQRKRPTWSTLKLGRKKRDFVDTILISEIKDEEPDWISYDQDEVTVKLQVADSILDLLIDDTITTLKGLEGNMNR